MRAFPFLACGLAAAFLAPAGSLVRNDFTMLAISVSVQQLVALPGSMARNLPASPGGSRQRSGRKRGTTCNDT